MVWRSIDTAPKDGNTLILGAMGDFQIYLCHWSETFNDWAEDGFNDPLTGVTPTPWMPKPNAPGAFQGW